MTIAPPTATPASDPAHASYAEFWAHYLLHHQAKVTRQLHFLGSAICLGGLALSAIWLSPWPTLVSLVLGYFCAFAGHWWIERNQPMTFRHPFRAGLSNWRLFGVECMALFGVGGGFDDALREALAHAPHVIGWAQSSGSQ